MRHVFLIALFASHLATGAVICYFGADLDQANATDIAKGIGQKFGAEGAQSSYGTDIASTDIVNQMKTAAGTCFDPATGKFKCEGGVLFVYISAHGAISADGKDTVIANPRLAAQNKDAGTKISDLANSIAATIPECCTLIFAFDSCGADGFYNNFINPGTADVNDKNPFKGGNSLVLTPKITAGDHRCIGTPVGDAIKAAFGTKRTVKEFVDFFGNQAGVTTTSYWDDVHSGYPLFKESTDDSGGPPLPEPAGIALAAVGLCLIGAHSARRRYRSKFAS